LKLAELNTLPQAAFVAHLGAVFEHSPWAAERAYGKRPFGSIDALHRAMMNVVSQAGREEQLALLRAHPELAGAEAKAGTLTMDSSSEQERLGFTRLTQDELATMSALNRGYREKHGFPCIVALRLHSTRQSVMAEMQRRIANDSQAEMTSALEQIGHITRGRLAKILEG
jgi:2-oxo-4-hydroxy-4-carboxy-5-ureidoimidazoline decarboxylase